jgi:thiamine biosynthesis lipoprotein
MRRCRPLLGTFVEIDCDHAESIEAGFAAIERVHKLMSAHDPDSELSRINRIAHLAGVRVSPELAEVLDRALFWSRISNGAFDVARAGAVALRAGDISRHAGQDEPDPEAKWTAISLRGRTVSLATSACLNLGGIAKGYAVDRAINSMRQAGAAAGLVNAGGDLRAFGPLPWRIAVVEPFTRKALVEIGLADSAMATSAGLAAQEGLSFDHLDGRRPDWTSVTVQASNACDSDAMTKILWSLGERAGPLLASAKASAFAINGGGKVQWIGQGALAA